MKFLKKMKLKSLLKKAKNLYNKRDRGDNVNVKHEIKVLKEISKFYDGLSYHKGFPNAKLLALEYYRAAANLGDPESQYIFAQRQLEQGKFWDEVANDIYGRDIHKTYAKEKFDEAFNYLGEAENNGHALAKRLHGMAYIHGWGLDVDQDKGFQLVVDSIEEEGTWDKATKIFEELGLNKSEFFSKIMAMKKASH